MYDPDLIQALETALLEQAIEINELRERITIQERAFKNHALNYDAHKI